MAEAYFTGLALGFSLIAAIGAQNAFVLRQGLLKERVGVVCLICALSDAVLITFGVSGFQTLLARWGWLEPALRYGGAAFLLGYGGRSFYSAWRSTETLIIDGGRPARSLARTVALCLALTWLNPHVYIDTVVMMGMLSTGFPGREAVFAAGAITASFAFFFALGYGARLLRPVFASPRNWRVFEGLIGALMWFLAARLIF